MEGINDEGEDIRRSAMELGSKRNMFDYEYLLLGLSDSETPRTGSCRSNGADEIERVIGEWEEIENNRTEIEKGRDKGVKIDIHWRLGHLNSTNKLN